MRLEKLSKMMCSKVPLGPVQGLHSLVTHRWLIIRSGAFRTDWVLQTLLLGLKIVADHLLFCPYRKQEMLSKLLHSSLAGWKQGKTI